MVSSAVGDQATCQQHENHTFGITPVDKEIQRIGCEEPRRQEQKYRHSEALCTAHKPGAQENQKGDQHAMYIRNDKK